MSRIGKKSIIVDKDVKMSVNADLVSVEGPLGKMSIKLPQGVTLTQTGDKIEVKTKETNGKAIHGLYRSLVQNALVGVKKGWQKTLEMVGVGFRAQISGNELILSLGFSHPIKIQAPPGISFQVNESKITISGTDKYLVGEVAAGIRRIKKPEPYKGKGIRYQGEFIRKKLGKAAKAVGATGAK